MDVNEISLTGKAQPEKKKNNNVLYFVIGIVAIVGVGALSLLGGPESTLNKYGEAFLEWDENKLMEVIHPNVIEKYDDLIDLYNEDDEYDENEFDNLEEMIEIYFDDSEDEGYEFKAFEIEKDFEEIKDDDLEEIAESLEDTFDIKKKDVKAARRYELEFKLSYDDETEREDIEILVVKVGSKWYIFEDDFVIDGVVSAVEEVNSVNTNNTSISSFILHIDEIVTAVQTQYMYDANGGAIAGSGYYVYDITQDINLSELGGCEGYVVVDASDVDSVEYILSIYNKNYQLLNYNYTLLGLPTIYSSYIEEYDKDDVLESAGTAADACEATVPSWEYCYNRKGYLVSGYYS